jgi:spore maturation protein CgeB
MTTIPLPAPGLPRERRILYVGTMAPHGTIAYRHRALLRLGQTVEVFDTGPYAPRSYLLNALRDRFPFGALIAPINRHLPRAVRSFQPDVVWFDKPTLFHRASMNAIHKAGARIVFYVQDAPYGPRNDGVWKQFYRVSRMADLHCLVRQADAARYRSWGLPFIQTMFSFDRQAHFPPPPAWSDDNRDRGVSYIGHPHEDRPAFLMQLARDSGLPIFINGNRWQKILTLEQLRICTVGGHFAGEAYRENIWRSKINLSFVTRANQDDIAHKAVEIAACAGFLLALRTPGHQAAFEEDKEAVFFSSVEECADKARFYLNRPDLREAIGRRARERAVKSGYDNDTQLARILNKLDGKEESAP